MRLFEFKIQCPQCRKKHLITEGATSQCRECRTVYRRSGGCLHVVQYGSNSRFLLMIALLQPLAGVFLSVLWRDLDMVLIFSLTICALSPLLLTCGEIKSMLFYKGDISWNSLISIYRAFFSGNLRVYKQPIRYGFILLHFIQALAILFLIPLL